MLAEQRADNIKKVVFDTIILQIIGCAHSLVSTSYPQFLLILVHPYNWYDEMKLAGTTYNNFYEASILYKVREK